MIEAPFFPIVYVRGYAGSQGEVEDTVADPYMGFNLGSTKLRQSWTGDVQRHIFESPVVRLMKDLGYTDGYSEGAEIPEGTRASPRSIWIYRYYEPVSKVLGTGKRPEIEDYAEGLDGFLRTVRDRVCGDDPVARDRFRVYLVAHSMGGLVVRCYLQNIARGRADAVAVDKVFTYATPHGGIDFRLVGNVPAFLKVNNVDNFNEARMREYLNLSADSVPVHSLDGAFPPERFFCLVGTDSRDYTVAGGASSALVGPMSDGLVQIKNAAVEGAPRAFVHRSHSGHFGIVNSEEGYQNLTRFLFGDARVDGRLEIEQITLPPKVERAYQRGKKIRASYHLEVVGRLRGMRWDLHRRLTRDQSAIFRSFDSMVKDRRPVTLFSTFLAKWAIVAKGRRKMGFGIDLAVQVPEYTVDGLLFLDDHIDGGYLFRDKLNLELELPAGGAARLRYGWDTSTPNRASRTAPGQPVGAGVEFRIPVVQNTRPGLKATLVLSARPWS